MNPLPPLVSGARPLAGHALEFYRDPLALFRRGHEEHGTVFRLRLGPAHGVVLLGNDNDRWFFLETDKSLSMSEGMKFFNRMFDPDFYFMAEFDEYKRQREVIMPRFQARQLQHYVTVMERETAATIEKLGTEGEFDMVTEFGPLVMRIAANSFLGEDFGRHLGLDFFTEFRRFSAGLDPITPGWVPAPHLIRSRRARTRLRAAMGRLIQERRDNPHDPPDFLQALCTARYSDGDPVPDRIVTNMVLGLTWAGHETTTGQLAWALIDLLQNPDALERVRAERREHLPDPSAPLDLAGVRGLRYLDAALHETERMHPIGWIVMRAATEDIEVNGHRIPKGSRVFLSPALTHRLPEQFADPEVFRPERFIEDPKAMGLLSGFGGGMHRCLGARFAYLEMQVIATMLLRDFDLELLDRDPEPMPGPGTKWPTSPCRVRYRARSAVGV